MLVLIDENVPSGQILGLIVPSGHEYPKGQFSQYDMSVLLRYDPIRHFTQSLKAFAPEDESVPKL